MGGAVDHGQAFTGGLVGLSGRLRGLGGAAGNVLGGGAHLVGGGGNLVDLTVLLLHAGAGFARDRRGLVGGATGGLHRTFDLGNGGLQLVEETVEPAGQFAQLVLLLVGQTAGQVTLATGDVLEHRRHAQYRPGDTTRHQPHQQQASDSGGQAQAQFQQGAAGVQGIEFLFQRFGRPGQGVFRHIQQHAPGLGAGDRFEGGKHLEALLVVEDAQLALGQFAYQFGALGGVHLVKALGQLAGIGAVTGQQPHRAENADSGTAFVEAAAGVLGQGLQAVEVDVDGQRSDHLAVDGQGENDAGHQHALAIDVIEVGLHHADLARAAWAYPPGIGRLAAGADFGVGHVMFGQGHGG
ncbi:hypothetical protein D3C81_1164750 [compost metagenome]